MNENQLISQFRNQIMAGFYRLTCNHFGEDNYDVSRFGKPVNGLMEKYDINSHINFLYYFLNNTEGFFNTRNLLSDSQSQNLFVQLILYRLLGFPHVKLSTNNPEYWLTLEKAKDIASSDSIFDFELLGKIFRKYEFNYLGEKLLFDGFLGPLFWKMYDYKNEDVIVMVEEGDVVYDCGSCLGDSTLKFAVQAGKRGVVEAFDFIPNHIEVSSYNVKQNPEIADRINIHPYAVGEKTQNLDKVYVDNSCVIRPGASISFKNNHDIPMASLDDLCREGKIRIPDYIKMDIEGYEAKALLGAKGIIQKYKPKLAISLYHRIDDFVTIPALIKSMAPDYNFYLGHYTIHQEETVLYARTSNSEGERISHE